MKNLIRNILTEIVDNWLLILTLVIIVVLSIFILKVGVERQEQMECHQWQLQSYNYEFWYSLQWQKEQCFRQGIRLR
jgi:hypothetical protein